MKKISFKNPLKLIFKKGQSSESIQEKLTKEKTTEIENGFLRLWSWALPIFLGGALGWFCIVCLEVWLDGQNGRNRPVAAVSSLSASVQEVDTNNMTAFLRVNPFKITPMVISEHSESVSDDSPVQIVGSLATAVLKGTSPGLMAWMEDQGKLSLVMLGDSFDVYTLEEVTYLDATFVKDDNRVVKEMSYSKETPAASLPVQPLPDVMVANAGQVIAPDPNNDRPGEISREMVNQLLENPFDELKRVRLRPSENEQGLQIQWINKDSILSQLGVQKNDVIRGINGIPFRNAMDITNSLSSLMASDQFVVEVMREGAPTSLQYVVR